MAAYAVKLAFILQILTFFGFGMFMGTFTQGNSYCVSRCAFVPVNLLSKSLAELSQINI